MNVGKASIAHVEKCLESGFQPIMGSLHDPMKDCTHILDDVNWYPLNKDEVQPFLDVVPIDLNKPNNLVLLLPPFNHKKFK